MFSEVLNTSMVGEGVALLNKDKASPLFHLELMEGAGLGFQNEKEGKVKRSWWNKSRRIGSAFQESGTPTRTLYLMFRDIWKGKYRPSWWTSLFGLFFIAYLLFPMDFIPDFLPLLGWADDGAFAYAFFLRCRKETHRYNRFKAMDRRLKSRQ